VPSGVATVAADRDKVRQVLVNLVENAIKYSPTGGKIEVGLEPGQQPGETVVFYVKDEGLGIPVEEQARIFEKFYRLDPQMTRGVGGTGLGLYICAELVNRMGGHIWVESVEGQGSTFLIELPAEPQPVVRVVQSVAPVSEAQSAAESDR
jgi:signal transduction histidine kinase